MFNVLPINKIIYYLLRFFFKRIWNIFFSCTYCTIKFVYVAVPWLEPLFRDILITIFDIDFKFDNINHNN